MSWFSFLEKLHEFMADRVLLLSLSFLLFACFPCRASLPLVCMSEYHFIKSQCLRSKKAKAGRVGS